jgi:hypothetical protein
MIGFRIAAVTAALLAGAGIALAQNAWVEVDDAVDVAPLNAQADVVDDWDVYNGAGAKIGEVETVIGPDRNTPTALVVDFEDDAGLGDRDDLIVPLDRFALNGQNLTLDVDAAAVAAFVEYRD